jgi:hypothetical protein
VGELDVRAVEREVFTDCLRSGDAWDCTCGSRLHYPPTPIEVEADNGWDACTAAAARCPEVVEADLF